MRDEPKDETFRHITCEHLTIVHPINRSKIDVSVDRLGAYIDVYNKHGHPVIKLSIKDDGAGSIQLVDAHGQIKTVRGTVKPH